MIYNLILGFWDTRQESLKIHLNFNGMKFECENFMMASYLLNAVNILQNGGQNGLHTSHLQTAQDIVNFFKGHDPCYLVLKFGGNFASRNRDMTQNVILQGCDLERSRSSVKVKSFSISTQPSTHKYIYEVSWRVFCHFLVLLTECVARKRKKIKRETL